MERAAWTDHRLDDKMTAIETTLEEMRRDRIEFREEMRAFRAEVRAGFAEMHTDITELRQELFSLHRYVGTILSRFSVGLLAIAAAGMAAVIGALLQS